MCLPLLIAFSSLSHMNTTLKIGNTWNWYNMKFYIALRYRYNIIMKSGGDITWYNDVTSVLRHSWSTSRWKSNKKRMSPQYRVITVLAIILVNLKRLKQLFVMIKTMWVYFCFLSFLVYCQKYIPINNCLFKVINRYDRRHFWTDFLPFLVLLWLTFSR